MRINYLIDTDWIIHYLNGEEGIVGKLDELRPEGLSLSAVSLAELLGGGLLLQGPGGEPARPEGFS